jgi:3-hydroxyacyl-[acyl-carrier-protein] dehydratase
MSVTGPPDVSQPDVSLPDVSLSVQDASPLEEDVRVVSFDQPATPPGQRGRSSGRPAEASIVTTAFVDPAAAIFAGHYPGFPIFPGVCLIECAHRSVVAAGSRAGLRPVLTAVRATRFLSPVFPGQEVSAHVTLTRLNEHPAGEHPAGEHRAGEHPADGRWEAKATVSAGERRVASVRLEYALGGAPPASGPEPGPVPAAASPAGAHQPADIGEIARRLPHRHPMLLVDRVAAITPGRNIAAVKAVTASEPWFRPRSPGQLTVGRLPATVLIESWCQAACLLATWDAPVPDVLSDDVLLFGSLADVALPTAARVGDLIEHRASLTRQDGGVFLFEGDATVAGRQVLRVGQALVARRPAAALTGAGA